MLDSNRKNRTCNHANHLLQERHNCSEHGSQIKCSNVCMVLQNARKWDKVTLKKKKKKNLTAINTVKKGKGKLF